jgi:hypothetical protein
MNKRLALAVLAVGFALGAAAACSFPNIEFASEEGSETGTDAGGGGDVDVDGQPLADGGFAPPKPDVDPEGGTKDATTVGDSAVPIDASGCVTCDCDKDTYNRLDLASGCDGGPPGKTDCDDLNAAIHPGQAEFIQDPWPSTSKHKVVGDWDCSGATTKQFSYGAQCGLLSSCANGFVGNPTCGGSADFITCGPVLPIVGCSEQTRQTSGAFVQGCH